MWRRMPRRATHAADLLALAHLSGGAIAVTAIAWNFDYSLVIVPLHLAFLVCALALLACPLALLVRLPDRIARPGVAALLAVASTSLLLLYALAFATNAAWGRNLHLEQLKSWRAHLEGLLSAAPTVLLVGVAAGLLLAALIFTFYLFVSRPILDSLVARLGAGRPHSLLRDRRRAALGLAPVALLALGLYGVRTETFIPRAPGIWSGEPISDLVAKSQLPIDARRVAEARRDARLRLEYPRHSPFEARDVVIFMVDCLRADHLSVYGYGRDTTPFLRKLHDSGRMKRVELALATCSESVCGVLSTLSSRGIDDLTTRSFSLQDVLHDRGYRVHFLLSGDHEWYGLRALYGNSIDVYQDGRAGPFSINDDRNVLGALEALPENDGRPAFFYLHLMSAHTMGVHLPEFQRFQPAMEDLVWGSGWRDWILLRGGHYDTAEVVNHYDNGVLQADDLIRRSLSTLDRKGYLGDALVLILGDHGESLGEHGAWAHTHTLYQHEIRIPLLILDPEPDHYANLVFATQTDVAPTVLARLGLPIPVSWQGHSLLDEEVKTTSWHAAALLRPRRALVHRKGERVYKYLRHDGRSSKEELYELTADPSEESDLMTTAPAALVAQLRRLLGSGAPSAPVARGR